MHAHSPSSVSKRVERTEHALVCRRHHANIRLIAHKIEDTVEHPILFEHLALVRSTSSAQIG